LVWGVLVRHTVAGVAPKPHQLSGFGWVRQNGVMDPGLLYPAGVSPQ